MPVFINQHPPSLLVNSEDVKMPVQRLTPILACLLLMWRILTLVSSHPQHSPCQLVRHLSLLLLYLIKACLEMN